MRPPTPDFFQISTPFPGMNGSRIRITRNSGITYGTIVCFERPSESLFGVRLDIVYPPVMDPSPKSATTKSWERIGEIPVEYLSLSQGAIGAIQKIEATDFEFTIDLRN